MATKYKLLPNESIILQEVNVCHGNGFSAYTDDLLLTNLNIVLISKGMFGNVKGITQYPLNQIKMFNGKPQAIRGKQSNGSPCLDIYFTNGSSDSFSFHSVNRTAIDTWIYEINKVLGTNDPDELPESVSYDPNSLVGAFKEVGDQFKDVGSELLGAFGLTTGKKRSAKAAAPLKVSKKCISCSAPLVGYQGKTIKCKYCDTEQTL